MPKYKDKDEFTYGIIAAGMVGKAAKQYFKEAPIYDKYKPSDSFEDVCKQDIILICLPTPFHIRRNETNLSAFYKTFNKIPDGKIVLIKSTVPVGTCVKFQQQFPKLIIMHNPEFLTERYAYEDFSYPDKQIIGMTKSNQKMLARRLLADLPYGHRMITTSNTSELIKYAFNSFYAMKVAFANQIFDIAGECNASYGDILKGFIYDKRANPSHLEVSFDGYRGYDGSCLPKDVKELIRMARSRNCEISIMEMVDDYNERLIQGQNIKKARGLL